jgi:uncharacterized protein CbrC (UPF0167 family)
MSNSRFLKLFSLPILVGLFTSSCTVYYNTKDVDKTLKSSVDQVNSNCNDLSAKLNSLLGLFAAMNCPSEQEPIKSATTMASEVEAGKKEMVRIQQEANKSYADFQKFTSGKDKIASGTAEWKQFKSTKKWFKKNLKQLQKTGETTIKKAEAFNVYINENIVTTVKVCVPKDYIKNVEKSIQDFPAYKSNIDMQLARYKEQVSTFSKGQVGTAHPDKIKLLQDDLAKLTELAQSIDGFALKLKDIVKAFVKATQPLERIFSCADEWKYVTDFDANVQKVQNDMQTIQQNISQILGHMQQIIDQMKE